MVECSAIEFCSSISFLFTLSAFIDWMKQYVMRMVMYYVQQCFPVHNKQRVKSSMKTKVGLYNKSSPPGDCVVYKAAQFEIAWVCYEIKASLIGQAVVPFRGSSTALYKGLFSEVCSHFKHVVHYPFVLQVCNWCTKQKAWKSPQKKCLNGTSQPIPSLEVNEKNIYKLIIKTQVVVLCFCAKTCKQNLPCRYLPSFSLFWSQLPSHCQTWVQVKLAFVSSLCFQANSHIVIEQTTGIFLLFLLGFLPLIFKPNSKVLQVWHKIHSYVYVISLKLFIYFCVSSALFFCSQINLQITPSVA